MSTILRGFCKKVNHALTPCFSVSCRQVNLRYWLWGYQNFPWQRSESERTLNEAILRTGAFCQKRRVPWWGPFDRQISFDAIEWTALKKRNVHWCYKCSKFHSTSFDCHGVPGVKWLEKMYLFCYYVHYHNIIFVSFLVSAFILFYNYCKYCDIRFI